MSRKILAESSKNRRMSHGSLERRWSNSRDLRDVKLTDVLPLERQWEVCQLPSTLSSTASSFCPLSFPPPPTTRPRHPGKSRAAEQGGWDSEPICWIWAMKAASRVILKLVTAPPRPSRTGGWWPRGSPQSARPGTRLGLGLSEELLGWWEEAGRHQARQCPELWFFLAGKASKPTGWN